jgi:hypothetical protein
LCRVEVKVALAAPRDLVVRAVPEGEKVAVDFFDLVFELLTLLSRDTLLCLFPETTLAGLELLEE